MKKTPTTAGFVLYILMFMIVLTVLTTCSKKSSAPSVNSSADSDSSDGEPGVNSSADSGSSDGEPSDNSSADTGFSDSEYDDGPAAHCCAEGQGTSCCEGREPGTCFEYGGIYGECITEGNEFEAKVMCAKCCEGLQQLSQATVVGNEVPPESDGLPEECDSAYVYEDAPPPSLLICLPCGNGICDDKEHECNCPEDCKD